MAIFDPPQNPHPLTNHQKIWYRWLRRRPLRLRQMLCKSVDGWLLGKWVKYYNEIFFLFIYTFFHQLTYRSDATTNFHAWWLKRHGFAQGCGFWGFCWHCYPFWEWNPPKTPILGTWIGVSSQTAKILEVSCYRNYCIDFNQILHNDRHHQEVVAGGPNRRLVNRRWRTAAI